MWRRMQHVFPYVTFFFFFLKKTFLYFYFENTLQNETSDTVWNKPLYSHHWGLFFLLLGNTAQVRSEFRKVVFISSMFPFIPLVICHSGPTQVQFWKLISTWTDKQQQQRVKRLVWAGAQGCAFRVRGLTGLVLEGGVRQKGGSTLWQTGRHHQVSLAARTARSQIWGHGSLDAFSGTRHGPPSAPPFTKRHKHTFILCSVQMIYG